MSRYDPPDPKCKHVEHAVRVSSHKDLLTAVGSTASVWVCSREACVEDAKQWVTAVSGKTPVLFRKPTSA